MRKDETRQRLIALSRWFGRIPSLGYAAIYLSLIPLFALVYFFLPDHFYHNTIPFERSLHRDERVILQQLQNEIIKAFKNNNGDEGHVGTWSLSADSIRLRELRVSASDLSFKLEIQLADAENKQRVFSTATIRGPLNQWAESVSATEIGADEDVIEYRSVTIEALPTSPFSSERRLGKVLFPESIPKMQLPKELFGESYEKATENKLIMPISRGLNDKILNYEKGTEGFPSGLTGNLVRMFYLSAATITTLGYGDIVPVSTASRILVSVEAILGVVIVGLFLNALAHERENSL